LPRIIARSRSDTRFEQVGAPLQFDLRVVPLCRRPLVICLRRIEGRAGIIDCVLDRIESRRRIQHVGLRRAKRRFLSRGRRCQLCWIDPHERLALDDLIAFLDEDVRYSSRNLGRQVDKLDRSNFAVRRHLRFQNIPPLDL
jgi:hypothetical protein